MPTYSYICLNCANLSNITHSLDENPKECPFCKKEALQKKPSEINVIKTQNSLRAHAGSPGEVVKSSISEISEDVEREKEQLKSRIFDPRKKS